MMVKPATQVSMNVKNPSLEALKSFFDSPIVSERTLISHPVDGFLAPIELSPGFSGENHLQSQFAVVDPDSIPYIQKSMILPKGEYTLEFDWQPLSE